MGIYPSGHPPVLSRNGCYYVFVVTVNKLSLSLSLSDDTAKITTAVTRYNTLMHNVMHNAKNDGQPV